jgi:hypothetical protein
VYQVQVRATDSNGLIDTQSISVTVTNVVNEAALPTLTPSGSVVAGSNNQVIENLLITGQLTVANLSGVTIRNCIINHPANFGISVDTCTNILIQDVKVVNTAAPTGQAANPAEVKNIQIQFSTGVLQRVYTEGGCGLYAYQCNALEIYFFEGHKNRGSVTVQRGQLLQANQCTGTFLMEDFSSENPTGDSWTDDNLNFYQCTAAITVRRGLIDGNNAPGGFGMKFQSTSNALVEDVDMVRMGNGGPGVTGDAVTPSNNMIYRRCRARDTLQYDQGRGPSTSGYTTFISTPNCVNTHFEQCNYFNVLLAELAWDTTTMTVTEFSPLDFTPRAAIRNRTPGT